MAEQAPKGEGVQDEGKGCCGTGKRCCGGKALAAIALLAIGGAGGYFAGKCCSAKGERVAVEAPAQPAK